MNFFSSYDSGGRERGSATRRLSVCLKGHDVFDNKEAVGSSLTLRGQRPIELTLCHCFAGTTTKPPQ